MNRRNLDENIVLRFMMQIGDLFLLNFIWIVCCIPVITIGASTSAAYAVALKMVEDQHGGIFREFFHYFRKSFLQATLMELLFAVAVAAICADVIFALQSPTPIMMMYLCIAVVMAVFVGIVFAFGVPMQARYTNTILGYIRNSFSLAAPYLPKLLLVWAIWLVPILLCIFFYDPIFIYMGFLWLFCGFAALMYFHSIVVRKIFDEIKDME